VKGAKLPKEKVGRHHSVGDRSVNAQGDEGLDHEKVQLSKKSKSTAKGVSVYESVLIIEVYRNLSDSAVSDKDSTVGLYWIRLSRTTSTGLYGRGGLFNKHQVRGASIRCVLQWQATSGKQRLL
jgi:hypothetical protein